MLEIAKLGQNNIRNLGINPWNKKLGQEILTRNLDKDINMK
jgi:hypothetical protein